MKAIAHSLKENKNDFIAIVTIQIATAIGCYLMIPKIIG